MVFRFQGTKISNEVDRKVEEEEGLEVTKVKNISNKS